MCPDLWIPSGAADVILDEQTEQEEAFTRRLQAVDPRLGVFRAHVDDEENELRAGFYYVFRRNENNTTAFWEIKHPITGGFYEPDEAVIEAFRRWDANTHGSSAADRHDRRERETRAREKRQQDWKDYKLEHLKDEADYAFRVQVPVKDGVPQKVKAKT